jgi:hypothetical protein
VLALAQVSTCPRTGPARTCGSQPWSTTHSSGFRVHASHLNGRYRYPDTVPVYQAPALGDRHLLYADLRSFFIFTIFNSKNVSVHLSRKI